MKINVCWRAHACVHAQPMKTCIQCACNKGPPKCTSYCWIFMKLSEYDYIDLLT